MLDGYMLCPGSDLNPGADDLIRVLLGRGSRLLGTPRLLGLEVLVKQEECILVSSSRARDGEHSLATVIMGGLVHKVSQLPS